MRLERPASPEHGDFATNAALQLAPERKQPPREIAEELAQQAAEHELVERAEIAGPGFVNLWLAPAWYEQALAEILEAGDSYGSGFADPVERVQVEMVSANPTGPITVASARNAAYGDSVARLLEHAGTPSSASTTTTTRAPRWSDSARRSRRCGVGRSRPRTATTATTSPSWRGRGRPDAEDARADRGVAGALPDPLRLVGLQSELEKRLPELMGRLDTYEKDGAVWARSSEYGDEDDRVIFRSPEQGGTPTYRAADIVYLVDKLERGFDRAIYVLGADHHGTRQWYGAIARMLGYDPERVEVLLYQLVHLTAGGLQKKMSKRRGDVVFLDDFVDEIGVDAARWYLVNRGPDQAIDIDVDLAAEKTQKNPVYYVQYAHARIAGILRNAPNPPSNTVLLSPEGLAVEERELIKRLTEFPGVVEEAVERRGPHGLPTYAIRVADDFHRFYHEHRVLESEAEAFRLGLVRATQIVIAKSLDLIGVEAPERM